jgi:hypothetical protein
VWEQAPRDAVKATARLVFISSEAQQGCKHREAVPLRLVPAVRHLEHVRAGVCDPLDLPQEAGPVRPAVALSKAVGGACSDLLAWSSAAVMWREGHLTVAG